ncbi:hypothetical protein Acr_17g0003650 [Actinidia rufa]|uniref:NB-ARC domain-containing protein n=1 Tax=Actinidia rufa TaxID=165716 RepID=A0A7J0G1Z4_9ERIC|nr:hypothetical protein Acr_17g0003650 [Actinidia rufa]
MMTSYQLGPRSTAGLATAYSDCLQPPSTIAGLPPQVSILDFLFFFTQTITPQVGILDKVNGRKTCKLILITRSLNVCRWIGCQAKLKVQPLNEEEAWKLFEEKLGQQTELSPEVRDIAMSVAAKCWFATGHYYNGALGQEDMKNEVQPILEFSYSRLNDMRLKLCFLYCVWHPEDQEIYRDELIGNFIAEGKPWQAKFDEGHSMLNTLERFCLPESCKNDGGRCVKMHHLMTDMALKITNAGHPQFIVKADSFFEHMHALYVLDLSENRVLEKLPNSVSDLENVTALMLQDSGQPQNQNMELTFQLERLPSGTLGKLSHLQRLKLSTLGPIEVQAKELEGLRELKEIAVQQVSDTMPGNDCDINRVMILGGRYNVNGGEGEGEDGILLPYDLQLLTILGCSFARGRACLFDDVFPSLCGNAILLKECELIDCKGIQFIILSSISSYSSTSLQSLEKFSLYVRFRFPV